MEVAWTAPGNQPIPPPYLPIEPQQRFPKSHGLPAIIVVGTGPAAKSLVAYQRYLILRVVENVYK